MSIVPEEGSIISVGTNVNNEVNGKVEDSSSPTGRLKLGNNESISTILNKWPNGEREASPVQSVGQRSDFH